jgi:GNAT superfamily N-acetyltransferase
MAEGRVVGFCALMICEKEARLDHLWILPPEKGRGFGRALFAFAESVARSNGAASMKVESDPNAERFYVHMGAVRCGRVPAAMDGHERFLPLLEKIL